MMAEMQPGAKPRVVIVGAGFAGIEVAKELGRAGIAATVVDRQNHHVFQPLLYQVATAVLSAQSIASPIRAILRRYPSISVLLGEVERIDTETRRVICAHGAVLDYDILVLAPGTRTGYFGNEDWARFAPGMKSVEDARAIRSRILLAFERAEREADADMRARMLTFAVIGGGPTGVELAGSIAELTRFTLARDFHHISPEATRILLIEAAPRILGAFDEKLGTYALERLRRLGVTVMLEQKVEEIDAQGLTVEGRHIPAGLVVFAAGVTSSPLGATLGIETDRGGRVPVRPTLEVEGLSGAFALGDIAACPGPDGEPLPGLAQVAKQQGIHLGRALVAHIRDGTPLPPFSYHSRGNTAIVGRHAAIYETERRKVTGWPAWGLWGFVHVYLLVGFQNRLLVVIQWLWSYLTYQSGARVVVGDETGIAPPRPASDPAVAEERRMA